MVREQLADRGISDQRVLEAMLRVPRHVFLDHGAGSEAYSNHSFPIGFAQTMSQPYMVAYLTEQLELRGDERVLEVGTGSGYHAAVLGSLAKDVFTLERLPVLAAQAERVLHDLLFTNVHVRIGDGGDGWSDEAPFDRVLLTAAAREVPKLLLMQLAEGGLFVGPVEKHDGSQEVVRLRRKGNTFELERLIECAFVPMVRGVVSEPPVRVVSRGKPHGA